MRQQRLEKDQAATTESIWSFFDRHRDQFRSGMYMPSYYDRESPAEGLLGNGISAEGSQDHHLAYYFLRWVEIRCVGTCRRCAVINGSCWRSSSETRTGKPDTPRRG